MLEKDPEKRLSIDGILGMKLIVNKMREHNYNINNLCISNNLYTKNFGEKKFLKINIKDNNTEKTDKVSIFIILY